MSPSLAIRSRQPGLYLCVEQAAQDRLPFAPHSALLPMLRLMGSPTLESPHLPVTFPYFPWQKESLPVVPQLGTKLGTKPGTKLGFSHFIFVLSSEIDTICPSTES